jgi:hypothetical protein
MRKPACPKCQGTMSDGFVLSERYGASAASSWVEGPPRKSIWLGMKLRGKPIEIKTWRCQRCGFLENYANG